MASDLDRLLAPDYVVGLEELPMDELRSRRAECQEVETGLSYLRRLVQGRLDIVQAEVTSRAHGAERDLHALVDELGTILADHVRAPGLGRLPTHLAPADLGPEVTAELDAIAGPDVVGRLPDLADGDLRRAVEQLVAYERQVSDRRRSLHERIDALQHEIVRRYKTGEASVDALLK